MQSAVDAEHDLIGAHEMTMSGSDRQHLAAMSAKAKALAWHCQPKVSRRLGRGRQRIAMTRSANHFRYFDSSPEVIRLVVMLYVKYPLSLRSVEDLLFERGIDICHEGFVSSNFRGCG